MMMMAASLLICAAPIATAASGPDAAKTDKLERAKQAEQNGDLARIHSNYDLAAAYYQAAVRLDRQNPTLYNKLGIAELQLHQNGQARRNFQQTLSPLPPSTTSAP
jgi:Flp pilus assembly protein TadD